MIDDMEYKTLTAEQVRTGLLRLKEQAIKQQRRIKVYEMILRRLNAYGNLNPNHEKMRELMVEIMHWQHTRSGGEYTQEELDQMENEAFESLAKKVGL